jgi:hypothetical protein
MGSTRHHESMNTLTTHECGGSLRCTALGGKLQTTRCTYAPHHPQPRVLGALDIVSASSNKRRESAKGQACRTCTMIDTPNEEVVICVVHELVLYPQILQRQPSEAENSKVPVCCSLRTSTLDETCRVNACDLKGVNIMHDRSLHVSICPSSGSLYPAVVIFTHAASSSPPRPSS